MDPKDITAESIRQLGDDDAAVIELLEPHVDLLRYDHVVALAFALWRTGRGESGLEVLSGVLVRLEDDGEAAGMVLSARRSILTFLGQRDAAVLAADEALSALPEDVVTLEGRIDVDVRFGIPSDGGRAAVDRALEIAPADPRVLNKAMRFELLMKRRSTATVLARRLLQVNRREPDAYAVVAMVHAARLQMLRATKNAIWAMRIAPMRVLPCQAAGAALYFWSVMGECVLLVPIFAGAFVSAGRPWSMLILTYLAVLFALTFIARVSPLARAPLRPGTIWALRRPEMRTANWTFGRCAFYLLVMVVAYAVGFRAGRILDLTAICVALAPVLWHFFKSPKGYVRGMRATKDWVWGVD